MECKRLQGLVKSWYAQVQEESMAPARMVSFMEKHITECAYCLADPLVRQDIVKITAIILPPTKIRKPAEDDDALVAGPEEEDTSADEDLPGDDEAGIEDEETDDEAETLEDDELEDDDLDDDE